MIFLGMQSVPLKVITPYETKELTLDLVKNTNPYDPVNKKKRGLTHSGVDIQSFNR